MELRTLADAERYLDGFINRERVVQFDYEKLGLARIRGLLLEIGHPETDQHRSELDGAGYVEHRAFYLIVYDVFPDIEPVNIGGNI